MRPIPVSFGLFILSIFFLLVKLPLLFLGCLVLSSFILGHWRMLHLMETQPTIEQIRKDNLKFALFGVSCFICGHFSPILLDLLLSYIGGVLFGLIGVSYFYEKR